MAQLFPQPSPLAVAVSGGSDSLALLLLTALWQKERHQVLHALTVDHGLRAESATEAMQVRDWCQQYDIPHTLLKWCPSGQGRRVQEKARQGRYDLLEGWAFKHHVPYVLTGHTFEDQAETIYMRHQRPHGPLGLAGISALRSSGFVTYGRPLLRTHRADLQEFLQEIAQPWISDPSNNNKAFERIRVRKDTPVFDEEAWRQAVLNRQRTEEKINQDLERLLGPIFSFQS